MRKASVPISQLDAKTFPVNYIITNAQVDTLAKLFTPEIKKFFVEERTQKEFNDWKETQIEYVA